MLADKLSLYVSIQTLHASVEISAPKCVNNPSIKLTTDPDACFIENATKDDAKNEHYLDECGVVEEDNEDLEVFISELTVD
jgi:hypothetical protein